MFQVAAIQLTPIMNDVDGNIKRGVHFAKQAILEEADLIVFPELWTTGYHLSQESFRYWAEKPDGKTVTTFQEVAREAEVSIVCPFVEKDGDNIYISTAVIDTDGENRGVVRKSLLWGREQQIF